MSRIPWPFRVPKLPTLDLPELRLPWPPGFEVEPVATSPYREPAERSVDPEDTREAAYREAARVRATFCNCSSFGVSPRCSWCDDFYRCWGGSYGWRERAEEMLLSRERAERHEDTETARREAWERGVE